MRKRTSVETIKSRSNAPVGATSSVNEHTCRRMLIDGDDGRDVAEEAHTLSHKAKA